MYFIEASELAEKFAINQYCRWSPLKFYINQSLLKQGIPFQITIGGTNFWGGGKRNGCEGAKQHWWKNTTGGEWGEKEKEKGEKRKQQWDGERRTGNEQVDQELGKWGSVGFFSSQTGEVHAVNQLVIGLNRNTTHFQPFLLFIFWTSQFLFPRKKSMFTSYKQEFPFKNNFCRRLQPERSRRPWECTRPPGTRNLDLGREVFWIDLKTQSSASPPHPRYFDPLLNNNNWLWIIHRRIGVKT